MISLFPLQIVAEISFQSSVHERYLALVVNTDYENRSGVSVKSPFNVIVPAVCAGEAICSI